MMLALKVSQKEGVFYLVNYRAEDILRRIKFLSRAYSENEGGETGPLQPDDDISKFISGVEKSERAFQRGLMRRKVSSIVNFYETAHSQPMIPGPVLLYTPEKLDFEALSGYSSLGNLSEPSRPFVIIDGQHRLAGLELYMKKHPEDNGKVEVPAIIFDGNEEDFAAEMFVIINSTHTRISRSHLIDLMERVTYQTTAEKKWAAWIVSRLYDDPSSPLQYKINKLGGRSRQKKWILQSELFNEIYKLVDPGREDGAGSLHRLIAMDYGWDRRGQAPALFIEYFRAVRAAMEDIWGNQNYMLNTSVSIKALVRVLGDLMAEEEIRKAWRDKRDASVFFERIKGWKEMAPDFRRDGFYERFAAKGQVERVRVIHRELVRRIGKG
ncbi:MAG: DGQHR domain-containing protein [Thermoplasmatota archaeon]